MYVTLSRSKLFPFCIYLEQVWLQPFRKVDRDWFSGRDHFAKHDWHGSLPPRNWAHNFDGFNAIGLERIQCRPHRLAAAHPPISGEDHPVWLGFKNLLKYTVIDFPASWTRIYLTPEHRYTR